MEPASRKSIRDLEASPWIASLRDAGERGQGSLDVVLTPAGHDQLRDSGLEDFLERIEAQFPDEEPIGERFGFSPAIHIPAIKDLFKDSRTFPRLLSVLSEEGGYRLLVLVDSDLEWFEGHFPGTPVLPGVVQLHWAVQVSRSLFGIETTPGAVDRLKFQNVVAPPRVIELQVGRPDRGRIPFTFRSLDVTHSSGTLRIDGPS